MKRVLSILLAITFAAYTAVAQDSSPAPASFDSVFALLPTKLEREQWASYPEYVRQYPEKAALAQKIKDARANCRTLQSLITVGKPLSDYPGLLSLGRLRWDDPRPIWDAHQQAFVEHRKSYTLEVIVAGPRGYLGFECRFDQSWNVIYVDSIAMGI